MSYDFKGTYNHSIDAKNRINIPVKYRKFFSDNNESELVINYDFDQCITIYPKALFDDITESYRSRLNLVNKNHRQFLRLRTMFASDCNFDNQGRIALTQILKEKANIDKETVIIGAGDRIEIWNPKILVEHSKENGLSDQDLNLIEVDLKL